MNEGTLKAKWRRAAERHGFFTQALSPHQIRGMPDLRVYDLAVPQMFVNMVRTREHRIEAKVAHLGPRTSDVFSARRDATPHQILWCLNDRAIGLSAWWLVLSPDHWMLIPGDQLSLTRRQWDNGKREYGDPISELEEPEETERPTRKQRAAAMMATIQENRKRVAALMEGCGE